MNIDDYCKQINMSRDYSALYNLLMELGKSIDGRGIPCFVNYDCDKKNPGTKIIRDIATAKYWPDSFSFTIGARGIQYGGNDDYSARIPMEADFIKECERMNLEWVQIIDFKRTKLFRQRAYYVPYATGGQKKYFVDREARFTDEFAAKKDLERFACETKNRIDNTLYTCIVEEIKE